MSEKQDNSGVLFKNTKKEQPNHADYEGNCTVNGVEMWMNAWLKKDKNGSTFMSFSFKPKKLPAGAPTRHEDPVQRDRDDRIPF